MGSFQSIDSNGNKFQFSNQMIFVKDFHGTLLVENSLLD